MKIIHQKGIFPGIALQSPNGSIEFSLKLVQGDDPVGHRHIIFFSLFDQQQGRGDGDIEASGTVDIPADIHGLYLPMVFFEKIAENSCLLITKATSWTGKEDQGMIIARLIKSPGDFILLHFHPGGDAGVCRRVDVIDVEAFTVFLGDVHGGIGIGECLAPGDILHGQIFHDVLLRWGLDRLFLQDVEEFLKIIRIHIPQIIDGITVQGWREAYFCSGLLVDWLLFFFLLQWRIFIPEPAMFAVFIEHGVAGFCLAAQQHQKKQCAKKEATRVAGPCI